MEIVLDLLGEIAMFFIGLFIMAKVLDWQQPMSVVYCCTSPSLLQVGAFSVSTYGRFDIITKVHDYTTCSSHITCICVQQEQGIRVPLYVVKAQPIPMVSDMLEFNFEKVAFT